jgi:hypothetical protein
VDLEKFGIIQTNITIVYEKLDLEALDQNALRRDLVEGVAPVVTEIPNEMIALMYPQLQIACLLGDRRVRVNDGSQLPIEERPVAAIAVAADKLVNSKVVAYGFNYSAVVSLKGVETPGVFLKDRFLQDPDGIEERINGVINAVSLRLLYSQDHTAYQLTVEPEANDRIKVHLNAHFEKPDALPDTETLQALFKREFETFLTTLKVL